MHAARWISKFAWILILCAVLLAVLFPLLHKGFFVSDDGDWMVIRLTAFTQSLREGQFPVRFLGRLNDGYGYPVANFLYPGFLYAGSILKFAGLPFVTAVKAIIAVSVIAGAFGLFFWLRMFFAPFAAGIGTMTFLLSPYLLYDIYARGSVGEVFAASFAILSFWLSETPLGRRLLPVTVALLLISHNTLALLFGILLAGYLALRRPKALIPFGIGVILASFFWIPALAETRFVAFNKVTVSNPKDFAATGNALVLWCLGIIIAVFLAVRHHAGKLRKEFIWFSAAFLLSGFLATGVALPLWRSSLLTHLVQFPFRFLSVWFVAAPWLVSSYINTVSDRRTRGIVAALLVVSLAIPVGLRLASVRYTDQPEGFYATNEGTTTVADEYMPSWVTEPPKEHAPVRYELINGKGTVKAMNASTETYDLLIQADEPSTVRLSSIFYPGWGAMLDDRPVEIDYRNPRGLIDVHIPKGEHRLNVQFRETAFRFLADLLSVFGVVLYAGYLWLYPKNTSNVLKTVREMLTVPLS